MNARAIVPLIAGLGIAGLGAKLGFDYIKKAQGATSKTIQLWTPTTGLTRGMKIDEPEIRPLPFPADIAPKNAVVDKSKLIGRVPLTEVQTGVPILESMLYPPGQPPGIAVPPGMRAVAVKIDESSGVDYHLQPGCHVDVVGYFTQRTRNRNETIARTIIEDVEVAAVGARLSPSNKEEEDAKSAAGRGKQAARAVVLIVRPEDVPKLHLAEVKGKIKLSMRGTSDDAAVKAETVTEGELLGLEPSEPDSSKPGLLDSITKLLSQQPPAQPQPEPAAQEPTEPQEPANRLAWVMVVYNGEQRQMLGWLPGHDTQPIELGGEGPNIFQDRQPRPPKPDFETPPPPPVSDMPPEPDNESEESEPKELFE